MVHNDVRFALYSSAAHNDAPRRRPGRRDDGSSMDMATTENDVSTTAVPAPAPAPDVVANGNGSGSGLLSPPAVGAFDGAMGNIAMKDAPPLTAEPVAPAAPAPEGKDLEDLDDTGSGNHDRDENEDDGQATAAPGAPQPPQPPLTLDTNMLSMANALAMQPPNATQLGFAPISGNVHTPIDAMPDPFEHPLSFHNAAPQGQAVQGFARLKFVDGSYYVQTYSVMVGRDIRMARADMRRLKLAEELRENGHETAAEEMIHAERRRGKGRRGTARSVQSSTGGIVSAPMPGPTPDGEDVAPQQLVQALAEAPDRFDHVAVQDPNECPFVAIHPQKRLTQLTGLFSPNAISREHAKIAYNFERGCWELHVLSGNGLWHEDDFKRKGETIELADGDQIRIGLVEMAFLLPEIEGRTTLHSDSTSRPVSFSFDPEANGNSEDFENSSESELASVNPQHIYHHPDLQIDSDDDVLVSDEEMEEPPSSPEPVRRKKLSKKRKEKRKDRHRDRERDRVRDRERHRDRHRGRDRTKEKLKEKERRKDSPGMKLLLKLKTSKKEPEPSRVKEEQRARSPKRKTYLTDSDDDSEDEPLAKRVKPTPKEPKAPRPSKSVKVPKESKETKEAKETNDELRKDKGKAPVKSETPKLTPAEAPASEQVPPAAPVAQPPATPVEKKPEPAKAPKVERAESPQIIARRPPEGADADGAEIEGTITMEMVRQHNLPECLVGYIMEKRRGPGRPPKDGVMSKRQRAQLVKQGKEMEKAKAAGLDLTSLPLTTVKPKVARPRKDSNVTGEGGEDDIRESIEGGDGTVGGDKKQAKANKPPRTPSPEMRIEDYTEEQLQRPSANYVVLIHEAISSSKTGQMNLQQIYNYIERKYPWYKFKTTTSGWQSSVRHNLGQHNAFVKGDKEGKGFNWRINPTVSIEKERRKRQPSPQPTPGQRPNYYGPGYINYGHPGYYHPMPGQGAPNGLPSVPIVDTAQPRLPPSLARGNTATAPTSGQTYSSPWAGVGATGGGPPRPVPPSGHHPAHPAPPPSAGYGMLIATNPSHSGYGTYPPSGPYASQPPPGGPHPYPTAGRPYTPYPPPAAPNASGQPPNGHQQPTHPHAPGYNHGPPRPPPTEAHHIHPSGRYPASTNSMLISQLEAFRLTYLKATPLPKPEEEKKMDNVIRAVVNPGQAGTLTADELALINIIANIPTLKDFNIRVPEATGGNGPAPASGATSEATKSVEPPKTEAASSAAAAMAASNAAVAASALPKASPAPAPTPASAPNGAPPASSASPASGAGVSIADPSPGHPTSNGHVNSFQTSQAPTPHQAPAAPARPSPYVPNMVSTQASITGVPTAPMMPVPGQPPAGSMPNAPSVPTTTAPAPPSMPVMPGGPTGAPGASQSAQNHIATARPSVEPFTPAGGTPAGGTPAAGTPAPGSPANLNPSPAGKPMHSTPLPPSQRSAPPPSSNGAAVSPADGTAGAIATPPLGASGNKPTAAPSPVLPAAMVANGNTGATVGQASDNVDQHTSGSHT